MAGLKRRLPRTQNRRFKQRQPQTPETHQKDVESDEEHGDGGSEEIVEIDGASAYVALLQSLQSKGGAFAQAYAQRMQPCSDDEDDGDGSEESGEDAENGSDPNSETEDLDVAGISEDDQEEENDKNADRDGQVGVDNLEDEDADAELDLQSDEEQGIGENLIASTASAPTDCSFDSFKAHLSHLVTEEEISRLESGKVKFKLKFPASGFANAHWGGSLSPLPQVEKKLVKYGVKLRLRKHWEDHVARAATKWGNFISEEQCQFFALCNSYQDVLHTRTHAKEVIMDAYILHLLNHVLQTRDIITKNNEKLNQPNSAAVSDVSHIPRDQGFTRPKILVLLPLRSIAFKFVKRLLELSPPSQKATVDHKQRFFDDFGVEEGENDEVDGKKATKTMKPADYKLLFSGNNDDHFRLGLKLTRKSIKIYNDLYSSDIIVASPLGLMTCIGEAENDKEKDVDFLSSIEILLVDYTDVILMQNWSHVCTVMEHLNCIPSKQHRTDFMRVREWYLNGHARYYRQTIILSAYPDPGVSALFLRSCTNHAGKIRLFSEYTGVLSSVIPQVQQVYDRLVCNSIAGVDDARFEFFVKQVFPRIKDSLQGGTMLFVRSYFDFVRLRNYLKSQNASFCAIGDYTKQSDISRSRTWFFHGERRMMLYTERAHFYYRYKIRGIRDLIFYSLPDHAHFYSELVNMLEGVDNPSCRVIFSQFDNLQLERIIGSERTKQLLARQSKTFMFV